MVLSPLPYPHPRIPQRLRYPQWCEIATTDYSTPAGEEREFNEDGTSRYEVYYPYGIDGKTGKPIRVPCREVIIVQQLEKLTDQYPIDPTTGISRNVCIYVPYNPETDAKIAKKMYVQHGWTIVVFPAQDSQDAGHVYESTRVSIYELVNPHIEFLCSPHQ